MTLHVNLGMEHENQEQFLNYSAWNVCFLFVIPELPESMCLEFDCGAQIKLGFAAEFSNVLVIYTHIIKKPDDMSFCQAHVTDFSQVSMLSWTLAEFFVVRTNLTGTL